MADTADLKFILKMEDQFSSSLNAFGSQLKGLTGTLQAQIGVMQALGTQLTASAGKHDEVAEAAKRSASAHREAADAAQAAAGAHASHADAKEDHAEATREHAAALHEEAEAAEHAGEGHKHAKEGAEEHEAGLKSLINVTKEAGEAFAAMWAMTELREHTVGAWAELEVPLVRLKQGSGATKHELFELREEIEKLSAGSLNQSAEQLIAVADAAYSLKVGKEDVAEFVKTVSQLSTVTGMATGEITSAFSAILSSTGEAEKGAARLGDVFDSLQKNTRGGASNLLQTTQILAQMTAGMGLSSAQVMGLATAVDNLGVRSRMASGAIIQVFRTFKEDVENPAAIGKLRELANALDLPVEKVKELEKSNPMALFDRLAERMKSFEGTDNAKGLLAAMGLGSDNVEQTFAAISKQFEEFKKTQESAANAPTGSLMAETKELLDTLVGQMHRAQEAAHQLGEALGEVATPDVKFALNALGTAAEYVKKTFDGLPQVFKELVVDAALFAPTLIAAGTAFHFLMEIAETGVGTYRRFGGALGGLVKTLMFFKAGASEVASAEKALEGAVKGTEGAVKAADSAVRAHAEGLKVVEGALAGAAAGERTLAAAAIEGGAAQEAAAVKAEEAAIVQERAASRVGAAAAGMRAKLNGVFGGGAGWGALFALDVGSIIDAVSKLNGFIGDQSKRQKEAGYSWTDMAHSLGHSYGFVSDKDNLDYFKKRQHEGLNIRKLVSGGGEHGGHEGGHEGGHGEEGHGEAPKAAEKPQSPASIAFNQLEDLKGYIEQLNKLAIAEKNVRDLAGQSEEELHSLGLTHDMIAAEEQLIALRRLALDPLNEQRQQWGYQLASALAYNKLQEEAVAIEEHVVEARKKAIEAHQDPNKAESETRAAETNINEAARQKGFVDMARSYAQALQSAAALTQADKDRLEIEKQIQAIAKEKGFAPEDPRLKQLKEVLELTKQVEERVAQFKQLNPQAGAISDYNEQVKRLDANRANMGETEYKRERTKLDNDTLAARNPLGEIARSEQDELAALQVTGKYREADLKTLEQITKLKREGVISDDASGKAIEQQLSTNNRMIQDVKDLQGQLTSLTESFGSGLSGAIQGALAGQKYAFQKFLASFGGKMMDMGFSDIAKRLEPSVNGLLGGVFGKANGGINALAKKAGEQMGATTAAASATITSSTAIINASAAYINGLDAEGALKGSVAAPLAQSSALTTQAAAAVPGAAKAITGGVEGLSSGAGTAALTGGVGAGAAAFGSIEKIAVSIAPTIAPRTASARSSWRTGPPSAAGPSRRTWAWARPRPGGSAARRLRPRLSRPGSPRTRTPPSAASMARASTASSATRSAMAFPSTTGASA